ncbi:hypothetical protein PVAP13_2KG348800 [Panicum virgatum]|uniref:Uncharacterized protein n=1 Tax=Panicum virgatum TaxID=38727 RepID=A0A8T0WGP4_PANVG|nr:hypothetical protein PVAP13_2KG348800 [Panicum virgatum]
MRFICVRRGFKTAVVLADGDAGRGDAKRVLCAEHFTRTGRDGGHHGVCGVGGGVRGDPRRPAAPGPPPGPAEPRRAAADQGGLPRLVRRGPRRGGAGEPPRGLLRPGGRGKTKAPWAGAGGVSAVARGARVPPHLFLFLLLLSVPQAALPVGAGAGGARRRGGAGGGGGRRHRGRLPRPRRGLHAPEAGPALLHQAGLPGQVQQEPRPGHGHRAVASLPEAAGGSCGLPQVAPRRAQPAHRQMRRQEAARHQERRRRVRRRRGRDPRDVQQEEHPAAQAGLLQLQAHIWA